MTTVSWHQHCCPQCEEIWDCACPDRPNLSRAFCPNAEFCHIKRGETADVHTVPTRRRKSAGVGPLFHETKEGKATE